MKYTLLAFLAIAAIATFGATQTTKEYVDTKASNTLVTAKSYTDAKAVEVTALIPNTNDFMRASWSNEMSIVAGNGASASGGVNTVIGSGATGRGIGATAYGNNAMAIGQYTFAAGIEASATNYNSFVIGNRANSFGQDSTAVGNRAQAFSSRSTAVGFEADASGWNALSIGSYALANGLSSLSAGAGSLAYGSYATALGMSACASNSSSVAIGYNSKALHSSSLSFGSNAKSAGYNSVAVGASTEANQQSVAIGSGAKATGNQSVAIGRDAKATHTAAVAIGPTAETTADSTIRIAYNPSEIILGFWQPKSLQAYFNELTPTIDWSIASNIVRNAEFLPSKYYYVYRGTTNMTAKWQWSALGYNGSYSTTIDLLPANADSLVSMDIGDGAMISFKNGGRLNVSNGGEMWVPDPNAITFGSRQNQTNFNNYVKAIAQSAGGGVSEARVGEIATNVVRAANGGIWDATLQVWWTPVMANGKLTYQATTNVNLQAGN